MGIRKIMPVHRLKYFLYQHVGALNDAALKHRGAILLISALMLFIEPGAKATFGKVAVAGLGISIDPEQDIYIGVFLFVLLVYRLVAFWMSVLIESGTDQGRAERKALLEYDPSWFADEPAPHTTEQLIKDEAEHTVYKWNVRQILWEFMFPNFLAAVALTSYVVVYLSEWF